ncbi:PTS beta-glucoside transporter subunit IIBCA, partial [Streptococcus pyogenes]
GLATLSSFISETLPNNFRNAVIGLVISFAVSFAATFVLWKEPEVEPVEEENNKTIDAVADSKRLDTPLEGSIVPLENV